MRILHVFDHSIPLHSGYSFRSRAILEHQRALGWETFHVTGPKHYVQSPEEETVDGLHFYRSDPLAGWRARAPLFNHWAVVRALERRIEEVAERVRPDIIHAHSPALNGLAALNAGGRLGIPVVYEVRAFWEDAAVDHGTTREGSPRYRLTRRLETHVLRRADGVTCICEGLRADIAGRGIPEVRIQMIPNAVDAGRFTFAPAKDLGLARELGLGEGPVLGFIGSFYAYEGLVLLLRALPSLVRQFPEIRVLLVGGGPEEERLKAEVEALGLAGKVVFTGRVPHEQISRYYGLVDIFAYPRLPIRLTELVTPLKPLEAMAQGKLVVASDVGGHRELIHDGDNGFLFQAGSAEALASSIAGLLRRRDQWESIRQRGREFVETERSWPVSVGRYAAVYDRVLAGRAA